MAEPFPDVPQPTNADLIGVLEALAGGQDRDKEARTELEEAKTELERTMAVLAITYNALLQSNAENRVIKAREEATLAEVRSIERKGVEMLEMAREISPSPSHSITMCP